MAETELKMFIISQAIQDRIRPFNVFLYDLIVHQVVLLYMEQQEYTEDYSIF